MDKPIERKRVKKKLNMDEYRKEKDELNWRGITLARLMMDKQFRR